MTENKTTELKREYIDAIKNTVTAFANCDGGTIYIGINDDGTVCGVEDVDATMLRASGAIRDAIPPDITIFTEYSNEEIDGKTSSSSPFSAAQHDLTISLAKAFVPKCPSGRIHSSCNGICDSCHDQRNQRRQL